MSSENSDQLSPEAAIAQNQEMIKEWADECKMDGHLAFYMAAITKENQVTIFRSAAMDCPALIRQLEYVVASLKENPF